MGAREVVGALVEAVDQEEVEAVAAEEVVHRRQPLFQPRSILIREKYIFPVLPIRGVA